ncbi:MAG: hypothetical protein Q7V09_13905 [Hydrogenophaga sp.]|nr:hypothetical protein [Hydrogenophaga sp.]MDO9031527.1 hypothetical protein [Hydrogenophaga sp.]
MAITFSACAWVFTTQRTCALKRQASDSRTRRPWRWLGPGSITSASPRLTTTLVGSTWPALAGDTSPFSAAGQTQMPGATGCHGTASTSWQSGDGPVACDGITKPPKHNSATSQRISTALIAGPACCARR